LDAILSHAKTFDDSLKASSLLIKLLVSSSKFEEARTNCLMMLSNLEETFPSDGSLPSILFELAEIQATLQNITTSQIQLLPQMTDSTKLNAMKIMNMLCVCSAMSKPMMLPLISCRMLKLTMQHGFCSDSVVGLATAGYSVVSRVAFIIVYCCLSLIFYLYLSAKSVLVFRRPPIGGNA